MSIIMVFLNEYYHFRLVNGLASEKVRWAESVERMKNEEKLLPGDVLLTSAYLSYVGCFSRNYRVLLIEEKWMPFLKKLDVSFLTSFTHQSCDY